MLRTITTDIVIRKIFVARDRTFRETTAFCSWNKVFTRVIPFIKKSHAYTYSLFNVWPGVNADNRKSVGKSGEPVVTSFHVVDRFGSSEWKDGRVMYPVFARGMMEMI